MEHEQESSDEYISNFLCYSFVIIKLVLFTVGPDDPVENIHRQFYFYLLERLIWP